MISSVYDRVIERKKERKKERNFILNNLPSFLSPSVLFLSLSPPLSIYLFLPFNLIICTSVFSPYQWHHMTFSPNHPNFPLFFVFVSVTHTHTSPLSYSLSLSLFYSLFFPVYLLAALNTREED